jgi:hypothetical protein
MKRHFSCGDMPKSNAQLKERDLTKEEERVMIKGTASSGNSPQNYCMPVCDDFELLHLVLQRCIKIHVTKSFSCHRLNGQLQEGQVSGCFKSEISNHVFIVQGKIPH